MATEPRLKRPWLVAVWPGMGHVAVSAGYYLMAKLGMHLLAEVSAQELFDIEHVEIKDGIVQPARMPRSRSWVWRDPLGRRDLVVFIGEAQPPLGKYAFCQRLIEFARQLGVERVFTFAAMATDMRLGAEARVFGVATDQEALGELRDSGLTILDDGHIGGLNGLLLGAAAEAGLRGSCLLGEMPHVFAQLPFPRASLVVLEAFTAMAGIKVDLAEMGEQAREMDAKLGQLLEQAEERLSQGQEAEEDESFIPEPSEEDDQPDEEDIERVEGLLARAREDRSIAYELKRELDRLGLYRQYEDRFLDLFKAPG
jgi:proteasome assembly chaperone (PAC2) family protein